VAAKGQNTHFSGHFFLALTPPQPSSFGHNSRRVRRA